MAALKEVIIGNIRVSIMAGPDPSNRQMTVVGSATMYDQNINPTRTYTGDLTSHMTSQDRQTYTDLLNRFIAGLMSEYSITQADLQQGQAILDAAGQSPHTAAMGAPQGPQPVPLQMQAPPVGTSAPAAPAVQPGGGGLAAPTTPPPPEPVSTETGDGTLIPAP